MARFIRFGGAGPYVPARFVLDGASYLSTDDVNLLDADTAHIEQSVGYWNAEVGASSVSQSAAVTPLFGSFALMAVASGTNTRIFGSQQGTGNIVVTPSVEQVVGVWLYTQETDREAFVSGLGYNGTSFVESYAAPVLVPLTQNSWVFVQGPTFTPSVTVDNFRYRVEYRVESSKDPVPNGEQLWLDRPSLRLGSDPTFVPSLRIVSNLEMESVVDPDDWSIGIDQMIINTRGIGATNSGYQLRIGNNAEPVAGMSGDTWRLATASPLSPEPTVQTRIKAFVDNLGGAVDFTVDGQFYEQVSIAANETPQWTEPELRIGDNAALARPFTGAIGDTFIRDGGGGPDVARLIPTDYPGQPGPIPDGTTWQGSDGRIWTAHGNIVYEGFDFGDSVYTPNTGFPDTVFIEKTPSDMPDVLDDKFWVIGAGWQGDGFEAVMYDGVDNTGPVVAKFSAEDVGI